MQLQGYWSTPATPGDRAGVLLLHGFPSSSIVAEHIGSDMGGLGERLADEMGWHALSLRFRGCGDSTGDFSIGGWVHDARSGLDELCRRTGVDRAWVVGFGVGGAIALIAAADDERVTGVVTAASQADFDDWANHPERLLAHAHEIGVIRTPTFPPNLQRWKSEFKAYRPTTAAEKYSPRHLLVLHGSDDDLVPQFDARILADAHGAADLRIVAGAGHGLRYDPRGLAILLGWLERTRNGISPN